MTDLLIGHGSYVAIVVALLLSGLGAPVPEEVPVIAAGVLSSHGHLNPYAALLCCLFGALVGDCMLYGLGRHFGRGLLQTHHFWNHWLNARREAQAEKLFHRHGLKVFFVARFLVGLRTPLFLSAGILRVPFRRFLVTDLCCATVVVGTFFGLSHYFGQALVHWIRGFELGLTALVAPAVVVVVVLLWQRHRRKVAAARQSAPDAAAEAGVLPDRAVSADRELSEAEARARQSASQPALSPGHEPAFLGTADELAQPLDRAQASWYDETLGHR